MQALSGGRLFFKAPPKGPWRPLQVPCGKCIGCRLERSRQWAVRIVHEASLHTHSCFVTLTYDDDHCPSGLVYRDFRLFMRRLRKFCPGVRFFMCGEYGERFSRPHFHAVLFGCGFPDRALVGRFPSGSLFYRSAQLEELWPHGFSSIGEVTMESAAYVARYVLKKVDGKQRAEGHYEAVDWRTGEVVDREPEFARMSLKPGIAAKWFGKYRGEVFPRDQVVVNGVKMTPPKYYKVLLERVDELGAEAVAAARQQKAEAMASDNTPARLAVREEVVRGRLSFRRRSLQ